MSERARTRCSGCLCVLRERVCPFVSCKDWRTSPELNASSQDSISRYATRDGILWMNDTTMTWLHVKVRGCVAVCACVHVRVVLVKKHVCDVFLSQFTHSHHSIQNTQHMTEGEAMLMQLHDTLRLPTHRIDHPHSHLIAAET